MYKIGHRRKRFLKHIRTLIVLFVVTFGVIGTLIWYYGYHTNKTDIKQTTASTEPFDPNDVAHNIKINTPFYTMELPSNWKEISRDNNTTYNSIKWQMMSGSRNRWIILYTDRMPTDMVFNRIIPISITNNKITNETISENCTKFTPWDGKSLKVLSKWQNAKFMCDFDNINGNVIGVSEKSTGIIFTLNGKNSGSHNYMFVYTDHGIPEDQNPIITALSTLTPK